VLVSIYEELFNIGVDGGRRGFVRMKPTLCPKATIPHPPPGIVLLPIACLQH
jgi:hypothetical protein